MSIDLSQYEAGKKYEGDYDRTLKDLQERLSSLQALHILHKARTLIIIEGWDAAGKGGAIKRMTASLDPRFYKVFPISAPTEEEKDKHFLWRFWNKLPGKREISIWDRSHYGRVLVERVEGFVLKPNGGAAMTKSTNLKRAKTKLARKSSRYSCT